MILGDGPAPSVVLLDIQRLPDESMTSAIHQARESDPDNPAPDPMPFFQWGTNRWLLKYIRDGIELNTIATGNWKKGSTPKFEEFPSPKKLIERARAKREAAEKKVSPLMRIFGMFNK